MNEVSILINYSELAGFPLKENGESLTVANGTHLPDQLKRLLILYKNEILKLLNECEELYI